MIVNLVEEAGKIGGYVLECFVVQHIHCLEIELLHEAFRLGVIVKIATVAHGANEAICGEELSVIGRRILRTAIRVVNAALRRIAIVDRRLNRRDRQTRINRAADRIAHHAARPRIEDHGQVHKARLDRDVGPGVVTFLMRTPTPSLTVIAARSTSRASNFPTSSPIGPLPSRFWASLFNAASSSAASAFTEICSSADWPLIALATTLCRVFEAGAFSRA